MIIRNAFLGMYFVFCLAVSAFAQKTTELTADEFAKNIQSEKNPQVIDVRTQGEFRKGYIEGAMNYDISSKDFKSHVSSLDKSRPVYVYCLSGGRSAKAAAYLRRSGFENVYELKSGMMAWNGARKPVVKFEAGVDGMSVEEFRNKVQANNLVLVDFYAKWCAPCKQMSPYLESLKKEYNGRMTLLKIDADANKVLVDGLSVQALPKMYLYKDGKEVWSHMGYLSKQQIEQKIKENL